MTEAKGSGFCAVCGKETERKEQCGLINVWVCSTFCAYRAGQMFEKPLTPELDKIKETRVTVEVILRFIDWLNTEELISLCEYKEPTTPLPHNNPQWMPIHENYHQLINRFFRIDTEKADEERRMLEEKILEYQKRANSRRPS